MPQKGTIAKLPIEIKEEIDRLIREGSVTINDIVAHLRGLGVAVPRSTVGDYKKRMEEKLVRYREAQEVAGIWVARLGEQPDSQAGQLISELLKVLAFEMISQRGGGEGGIETDPMELMLLSKAFDHIASADKKTLDVRKALHAAWKAEAQARAEAAAAEVKEVAKRAGITDEAAARIRELVFGVVG